MPISASNTSNSNPISSQFLIPHCNSAKRQSTFKSPSTDCHEITNRSLLSAASCRLKSKASNPVTQLPRRYVNVSFKAPHPPSSLDVSSFLFASAARKRSAIFLFRQC